MLLFAMQPQESLHKVSKHPSGIWGSFQIQTDEPWLLLGGVGDPQTLKAPFVLLLEKDFSQNNTCK